MSNIGYDNWDDSEEGGDLSLSSEGGLSPPTYKMQTSSQRGTAAGRNRGREQGGMGGSEYSYDISDDPLEYTPSVSSSRGGVRSERALYHDLGPSEKAPSSTKATTSRRMSTDERMKEILARQQQQSSTFDNFEEEDNNTADPAWEQMRASIMEGVSESTAGLARATSAPAPSTSTALASALARSPGGESSMASSVADTSDSFELDDTDLQVGAYAARRSVEKTSERRRRESLNTDELSRKKALAVGVAGANSPKSMQKVEYSAEGEKSPSRSVKFSESQADSSVSGPVRTKVDESPNIRRSRRPSYSPNLNPQVPGGFQMSQALSSIEYGGERKSLQV